MRYIKFFYILALILAAAAAIIIFVKPQAQYDLNLPKQKNMKIASSVFENNGFIPEKYTCQGDGVNPPLDFSDVPSEAKSLVLIVDDPDAPMGTWTHWTVWNIKPDVREIRENSIPENAISGMNSSGKNGYERPCPPSGTHRYFFKLYALDQYLDLKPSANKADLERTISGHIIDSGELIGLYKK